MLLLPLPAPSGSPAGRSSSSGWEEAGGDSGGGLLDARLAVRLFAAPCVAAPAGPLDAAGRELDRLVASSELSLDSDPALSRRLLAGEPVTVAVPLQAAAGCRELDALPAPLGSQTARLQQARSQEAARSGERGSTHALLELTLLHLAQPDTAAAGSGNRAQPAPTAAADDDMELRAFVSAAVNVPLAPG